MFELPESTPPRVRWQCLVCQATVTLIGNKEKPNHCGSPMKPILVSAGKYGEDEKREVESGFRHGVLQFSGVALVTAI